MAAEYYQAMGHFVNKINICERTKETNLLQMGVRTASKYILKKKFVKIALFIFLNFKGIVSRDWKACRWFQ
jgi:hypothetical protein